MSENAAYLKCRCKHCGQSLEFPADGLGSEIPCPNCGQTTLLYKPADFQEDGKDSRGPQAEGAPKVHCLCPHCKNDFDFELGLLGQAVHCPACQWQGVPTREDVELSDFQALGIDVECLVRRLRNEPTRTAQPKPSIPIPPPQSPSPIKCLRCPCLHCGQQVAFPESEIGGTMQCPHCRKQTMLHRPAAPASQSARIVSAPKAAEGGKLAGIRLTRRTAIIATIILCCLGAAVWAFENWREREAIRRERETEAEKTRTTLAAELRLLGADLNTGINENDFLRQSARVRAAYDVAKANLTTSQNERFGEIDQDITACKYFWDQEMEFSATWNPSWVLYSRSASALVEKLNLKVQAVVLNDATFADVEGGRRLLPREMAKLMERYQNESGSIWYVPRPCLQQVMDKLGESIRSFLDDNSKD